MLLAFWLIISAYKAHYYISELCVLFPSLNKKKGDCYFSCHSLDFSRNCEFISCNSLKKTELRDINSQLQGKKLNCKIKSHNYLLLIPFFFFFLFLSCGRNMLQFMYILLFKSWGWCNFFYVFEISFLCLPRLFFTFKMCTVKPVILQNNNLKIQKY